MKLIEIDYSKIEVVEIDGVDHSDYPDYCDAYISKAYIDGVKATPDQLDVLNDDDQFRYESIMEYLQ